MTRMPQAFDRLTSLRFHRSLLIALTPVVFSASLQQGWSVLLIVGLSIGTAVACDYLLRSLREAKEPQDLSAPLWGLLLALLLPVQAPVYLPIVGAAFAVLVVKGIFGQAGAPWINPVLAAWAFLQAGWSSAFPVLASIGDAHHSLIDDRTTEWVNTNVFSWLSIQLPPGYIDLFLGFGHPATSLIVESGSVFLLLATVYLLAAGSIPWTVPASFFAAFCLPMVFVGGNTLLQIFAGTFLLNLFFLATDPSSRPLGRWNLVIYGALAGVMAFLLRTWGQGTDVGYAVLLMNLVVPWIDQRFRRKSLNDFRLT